MEYFNAGEAFLLLLQCEQTQADGVDSRIPRRKLLTRRQQVRLMRPVVIMVYYNV